MRKLILLQVFVCCLYGSQLPGQSAGENIDSTLEGLFARLRENRPDREKLEINDSIRIILNRYSVSDSIFHHRFPSLRFLGQITSPDSLVKLLTWNIILADGDNRYFCNIIRRNGKEGSEIESFQLTGTYNLLPPRTDTIYLADNWYGALYYDLRPFIFEGTVRYLVLGIDYGNSFITRKIIDVLSFDNSQGPYFGVKCFNDGTISKYRIIFEYSAKAIMSLKFESDLLVVFDHLSPFSPDFKDNMQFYGPDFSFDSFKFENGYWKYQSDVDIKNRQVPD